MGARLSRSLRFAAFFVATAFGAAAPPVLADTVRMSGSLQQGNTGDTLRVAFACTGAPVCDGTYTTFEQDLGCSNSITFSNLVEFTNVNVATPGPFSGTVTLTEGKHQSTVNADGTCTYTSLGTTVSYPYNANWTGTSGTISVTGPQHTVSGNFTANAPTAPVFPMTVNGSMGAFTSTFNAQIQPKPADVGKTESVYVFVHAPSNIVQGASPKRAGASPVNAAEADGAIVCVLAQTNSQGQLVAVSAGTMQAALTGVISSQGQAVSILNQFPTQNLAGSTVYVGYGASASAMLSGAVYQGALSFAGPVQCTASLASAPAPASPGPITGLWWNASESGWGIHFTQRGTNIFAAWYTYDASGNPKWYVASNCAGVNGTSGTCSGTLYQVNGPAFFGVTFNPALDNVTSVGSLSLTFTDSNTGSMTYNVSGQARTVAITRQPVAVGSAIAAVDYSDLWWNPNESGWGMAMAHQSGNIFLAWYVYDANGQAVWYVASNCVVSGSSCAGTLYRTTGPPFGPTFNPSQVQVSTAGNVIVSFIDANNAVLSYTVNGVTATKTVTRQLF